MQTLEPLGIGFNTVFPGESEVDWLRDVGRPSRPRLAGYAVLEGFPND